MKHLVFYFLLFTLLFACSAKIQDERRPYLHWRIEYVKADNETEIKDSMMVETLYIKDAISAFYTQCPYCEIRAIYRDYYYECQERTY